MSKLIYLESDEEITDVIGKISEAESKSVSLVIPRGSTLANSIVNLKLLVKRSKALKKEVSLVTNDNIAHNLASQIGLSVFESIEDAKADIEEPTVNHQPIAEKPEMPVEKVEEVDGVKVHQYDRGDMDTISEPVVSEEELSPDEPGLEDEPEIIEAVHDADQDLEPEEEINFKEKVVKNDEPADYKLEKRPIVNSPRGIDYPSASVGGASGFGKIRTAKSRKKVIMGSIIGGFVLLIVLGAFIAVPKAVVNVSVTSEPFSTSADITVNKEITAPDTAGAVIPGKLISKEEELEKPFAASGTKNIGTKAKGKITIYNYWDDKTHDIPAGSTFTTSAGVTFVSLSAVTVPAGHLNIIPPSSYEVNPPGTVDVNVEAQSVGEQSNIGVSQFTITNLSKVQQAKIYGKSPAAMTGGTNNMVKVIAEKDITDAKASTENELKTTLGNKIKEDLASSEKLLDSAIVSSVIEESASAKANDQVDTFNYKVKMKIEALVFSEDNFKTVLFETAKSKMEEGKEIVSGDNESVTYEVAGSDIAKGTISLKGKFDGYIANKYDAEAMKAGIKMKTVRTATTKLTSYPGVLSADIILNPKIMRNVPFLTKRIDIVFKYGVK